MFPCIVSRFAQPDLMRLLMKHGADPLFVHRVDYTADALITERRTLATTALMAARLRR